MFFFYLILCLALSLNHFLLSCWTFHLSHLLFCFFLCNPFKLLVSVWLIWLYHDGGTAGSFFVAGIFFSLYSVQGDAKGEHLCNTNVCQLERVLLKPFEDDSLNKAVSWQQQVCEPAVATKSVSSWRHRRREFVSEEIVIPDYKDIKINK